MLVLAVLAATGAFQYAAERRQLLRAQAGAQETSARALAKACEEAVLENNDIAALNHFRLYREAPALASIALAGPDGRLRLHSDALAGKTDWQGRFLLDGAARRALESKALVNDEAEEGGLRVARWTVPLSVRGGPEGFVRLSFDLGVMRRSAREQLAQSARRFLLVALCCLALGVAGAVWLARRLIVPIELLAEGARRFSEGDLKHRVAVAERSELGELAADLNRMAARLGEMDELKSRFFHQLTHDLRVPLASIQGYVELLLSGKTGAISEAQRAHLLQAEQGAQAVADFVDNILDLARMKASQPAAGEGGCEVDAAIRRAVDLVQAQAQRLGVGVQAEPAGGVLEAKIPEALLRRVVLNLVGNALKFTPPGGRVTVRASRAGEAAAIEVRDTGCGIPEDKLGRIFEEFYRVPETMANLRGPAGVGIGLSICKTILDSHGGRIRVASKPGEGACFTIEVPVVAKAEAQPA